MKTAEPLTTPSPLVAVVQTQVEKHAATHRAAIERNATTPSRGETIRQAQRERDVKVAAADREYVEKVGKR